MIIALAGRRVDGEKTEQPAFPAKNVGAVRQRVKKLLRSAGATALVSSAACGADLVALEAAGALAIRRRVVLPSEPAVFLKTSVADRPGNWPEIYARTIKEVSAQGDLVVAHGLGEGDAAYEAANERILEEALLLAGPSGPAGVLAVLVWNGPRKGPDITASFGNAARRRKIKIVEIATDA